jgi:SH3 domain protein
MNRLLIVLLAVGLAWPGATPLAQVTGQWVSERQSVELHELPDAAAITVGEASTGSRLEVLDEDGGWLQVETEDGLIGWVPDAAVSDQPPASARLIDAEARNTELEITLGELRDRIGVLEGQLRSARQRADQAEAAGRLAGDEAVEAAEAALAEAETELASRQEAVEAAEAEIAELNERIARMEQRLAETADTLAAERIGDAAPSALPLGWVVLAALLASGAIGLLGGWIWRDRQVRDRFGGLSV